MNRSGKCMTKLYHLFEASVVLLFGSKFWNYNYGRITLEEENNEKSTGMKIRNLGSLLVLSWSC
jgi:hypothetical protein